MEAYIKEIIYYAFSCLAYVLVLGIILLSIKDFKFHRQFYEQDPSFSYFRQLSDTVSDVELWAYNILITCFCIIVILILVVNNDNEKHVIFTTSATVHSTLSLTKRKTFEIGVLLISFGTTIAVTGLSIAIMKVLFTRPRPSFFFLCNYQGFRDAVDSGNFSSYLALTSPNNLGNTARCWDQSWLPDSIYSFPSGHSAISFCSMFWLICFFLHFFKQLPKIIKYLRFLLWIPLILACWIAYSRVYDYKHSELDVTVGCLIGIVCAYYFFEDYLTFFRDTSKRLSNAGALDNEEILPR
jgi:membrane-associated phospholipid phosphatase